MKKTQRLVGFLVVILLSRDILAMAGPRESGILALPTVLTRLCFISLGVRDFANVPAVCSLWNKSVDEKLWATIGVRISGIAAIKDEDNTWKEAARDWVMIAPHVLSMPAWKCHQIEYAICDEGFALFEGRLLANLVKAVVKKMGSQIADSKDFAALFLVYYMVEMVPVWGTTGSAARDAARSAGGIAARSAVGSAVGSEAMAVAWDVAGIAAWNDAENATNPVLNQINRILEIKDTMGIDGSDCKLSTLYILAHISQDKYFVDFFEKSFLAVKWQLEKEEFSRSIDEILSLISSYTWASEAYPSLAQNPHIMALKAVLMGLKPDMKEIGIDHIE